MNLCSIWGERIGFFFPISELGVEVEFLAPMWVRMFEEKKKLFGSVGDKEYGFFTNMMKQTEHLYYFPLLPFSVNLIWALPCVDGIIANRLTL